MKIKTFNTDNELIAVIVGGNVECTTSTITIDANVEHCIITIGGRALSCKGTFNTKRLHNLIFNGE